MEEQPARPPPTSRKHLMSRVLANAVRPSTMPNLRLKQLVDQVLDRLPAPHTEDVVEDVFVAIEGDPVWRSTYDRMVYESGKALVTSWASFWISHAEKRTGEQRETAARSSLIESYSRLVTPAAKRGKKVTEDEALKAMHDYFLEHRATMPQDIRDYRETIVTLIMAGVATDVAFAYAFERPSFAW